MGVTRRGIGVLTEDHHACVFWRGQFKGGKPLIRRRQDLPRVFRQLCLNLRPMRLKERQVRPAPDRRSQG